LNDDLDVRQEFVYPIPHGIDEAIGSSVRRVWISGVLVLENGFVPVDDVLQGCIFLV